MPRRRLTNIEKAQQLAEAKDATSFSQLTFLLELITSLNSDRNCPSSFQREADACNVATDSVPDDLDFSHLDSLAAILVQEHEIVAACYTSNRVSVISVENETIPGTDVEVEDDAPVPRQSQSSSDKFCHSLSLAAVANPDFLTNSDTKSDRNLHNVQIDVGVDLWTTIHDSTTQGWYFAFM